MHGIWTTIFEFLDFLLILLILNLLKNGNFTLLGPFFGRFLTDQATSPIYLASSIGSILSVEIFYFLTKFKLYLLGFLLLFLNPLLVNLAKEYAFKLGSVQGPIFASLPMFLTTIFLQNGTCRTAATGKRSYLKSIASLLIILFNNKFGQSTFKLFCCDINRVCLLLVGISAILSLKLCRVQIRYILLCGAVLFGLSALSSTAYQFAGVRQCLPSSATPYILNESFTLHARAESNTGFVSVVEAPSDYGKVLVMKCDHSILGGQYLEYDRDSIFGVFYFMDFVRFVKRSNSVVVNPKRALVIGLGIGVSAKTLIDSGTDVDVVEIDPILYQYALDYFKMPKPKNAYLQDARQFLEERSQSVYDYILHDVFSGGVVSPYLFSIEALTLSKRLLLPDGVFVVNFVGKLDSAAFKSVTATLQGVFKNIIQVPEDPDDGNVQNCLFFATDYGNAVEFDFLQDKSYSTSGTYRAALKQFQDQKRLVPAKVDSNLAILDSRNPLENEQYSSALLHFEIVGSIFDYKYFWTEMF